MTEIWGERLNVHPPFVFESTSDVHEAVGEPIPAEEEDVLILHDLEVDDEGNVSILSEEPSTSETARRKAVGKAAKKLLAKTNKITTARNAYEELLTQRGESLQQKLKLQEEQLKLEKERFQEDQSFSRDKLEFEKLKWEREFQLKEKELTTKELQIQAEKEVRLKELELQILKLTHPSK